MLEFELSDIFEDTSIRSMDRVLEKYIKDAIVNQLGFNSDVSVVVLPCDQLAECVDGLYHVDVPFEVFDSDGNTILAVGRCHACFTILNQSVFEDYDLEELELLYIDGHVIVQESKLCCTPT